jgi:DNA repair protein RadA/Sms
MVARAQNFVCQSCGAATARWAGRCEACGGWNTFVEEGAAAPARSSRKGRLFVIEPLKGETRDAPRLASGIAEFDRVTGGGLVPGSVLLLGGDPGIGKSTLLIEVAAAYARHGQRAVYISGEEAVAQVRLRAERLGLRDAAVELAAETSSTTSSPRSRMARCRSFWSSIRSRRCGRKPWSPRRARSRKCADRPAN